MKAMRSLLVALLIFGSLPLIVVKPHVGVLVWSWIGYMNPHRLTWGFAYDFPFAMVVALVTIAAWLFSREPKTVPLRKTGRKGSFDRDGPCKVDSASVANQRPKAQGYPPDKAERLFCCSSRLRSVVAFDDDEIDGRNRPPMFERCLVFGRLVAIERGFVGRKFDDDVATSA